MTENEDEHIVMTFKFSPEHVYQLFASLEFHMRNWTGYPKADPYEQHKIKELQYIMAAALMELSYQRADDS